MPKGAGSDYGVRALIVNFRSERNRSRQRDTVPERVILEPDRVHGRLVGGFAGRKQRARWNASNKFSLLADLPTTECDSSEMAAPVSAVPDCSEG